MQRIHHHWLWAVRVIAGCCLLIFPYQLTAQACQIMCAVHLIQRDANTVNIVLIGPEVRRNSIAAHTASFDHLCPGNYRLRISGIGIQPVDTAFALQQSTELTIELMASVEQLQLFEVHDDRSDRTGNATLSSSTLSAADLQVNAGKPLGELLKEASGVNSLQSGPTISKPIIHGLHSNRVLIINNGVRLEGQQWGSEHAPEIDPFSVARALVLKGAASLRYGSDAIGGVVLLEPHELAAEKGTQGEVRLAGMSNGWLGASSARIDHAFGGKWQGMGLRVQGTVKDAGNVKTPAYYLRNTGMREQDLAATWMFNRKRIALELSGSVFNAQMGIFTGSHVGNLNDLQLALESNQPKDSAGFSRLIERGYQQVRHETMKARACYHFTDDQKLELVYGLQRNHRREYDSGLPYSTDPAILNAPQADFNISTHTLDALYSAHLNKGYVWSMGMSFSTQGNVFTGLEYRALIPNFRNYGGGGFIALGRSWKKWTVETGLRYDYRWLETYRLNYATLQTYATQHSYNNASFTAGTTYRVSNKLSLNANVGSAWRAPNVNELYGNGVHQSAASYEIGDSTLRSERAYNASVSGVWENEKIRLELGLYRNLIDHFIYLRPLLNPVVTIAGAYPAFAQTQVNAVFTGLDADLKASLFKGLKIGGKLSLIRGYNQSIRDFLVFTPSNRGELYLMIEGKANQRGRKSYAKLAGMYVAQQRHVPPNSDYVNPPPAYFLMNFDAGISIGKKHPVDLGFSVYNIFNTTYREYLNRFRYFSDEQGRSFALRITVPFSF